MEYAIVESGGKQYRVSVGDVIDVETLPAEVGDQVVLDRVLLLATGDQVTIGQPTVTGATVLTTVQRHGKGRKATIFKYRAKQRYHVKTGHRQQYTRLTVNEILGG
ncbi:MAG: 50S ribosomal protein L21 [Chloroflexi bacterium]|nr:50S ribosomal protein L21 [Chloroflexota bacterium]MBU1747999.1 50S ribosomal protein L21 [Chloroflexota bacterium]MBU1877499.1 50S ribosomal protein L21 [Chloroflexota bacterium]